MPAKQPYRARLKASLIAAAQKQITEHGLAAIQARGVAGAAECSVGTLYNIFGDIDGLIMAVAEGTLHAMSEVLTAAARRLAPGKLETRLMGLATAYLDFATINHRRWRAVFDHQWPEDRPLPERYAADRGHLLALLEAQLAEAIPDPEARSDAANALFAAVHGIVLLALDAKLGPFEPGRCERRIAFVVGHVVRGLG